MEVVLNNLYDLWLLLTRVGDQGIAATPTALWHRLGRPVIDKKKGHDFTRGIHLLN